MSDKTALQLAMSMILPECRDDFDLGWNSALIDLVEELGGADDEPLAIIISPPEKETA